VQTLRVVLIGVLLAGCRSAPEVRNVYPRDLPAGQSLGFEGDNFRDGLAIGLVDERGVAVPLPVVRVRGPGNVDAVIPEATIPGRYSVTVGDVPVDGVVVEVRPPRDEEPCTGAWTTNTQLSLPRHRVVMDRFGVDGSHVVVEVAIDDIAAIELVRKALPDGTACSAILLRRTDGRRIVFQDDLRYDLGDRAARTAAAIGRPLEGDVAVTPE
jgi:hypothetical protein